MDEFTGEISDGFGDAPRVETTLLTYEGWIRRKASFLLGPGDPRVQDVAQEGRIAMWRALDTHDPLRSPLGAYLTMVATRRMQAVAYGDAAPTGHTRQAGRPEVKPVTSVEAVSAKYEGGGEDVVAFLWGMVDTLGEVEVAYHRGEIMEALHSLTVKQRTYVYARFWCGIDMPAGSRNEGIKMAKEQNPILRRDVLWTGNKTTTGAKDRLAEALSHLRDLVTA